MPIAFAFSQDIGGTKSYLVDKSYSSRHCSSHSLSNKQSKVLRTTAFIGRSRSSKIVWYLRCRFLASAILSPGIGPCVKGICHQVSYPSNIVMARWLLIEDNCCRSWNSGTFRALRNQTLALMSMMVSIFCLTRITALSGVSNKISFVGVILEPAIPGALPGVLLGVLSSVLSGVRSGILLAVPTGVPTGALTGVLTRSWSDNANSLLLTGNGKVGQVGADGVATDASATLGPLRLEPEVSPNDHDANSMRRGLVEERLLDTGLKKLRSRRLYSYCGAVDSARRSSSIRLQPL